MTTANDGGRMMTRTIEGVAAIKVLIAGMPLLGRRPTLAVGVKTPIEAASIGSSARIRGPDRGYGHALDSLETTNDPRRMTMIGVVAYVSRIHVAATVANACKHAIQSIAIIAHMHPVTRLRDCGTSRACAFVARRRQPSTTHGSALPQGKCT